MELNTLHNSVLTVVSRLIKPALLLFLVLTLKSCNDETDPTSGLEEDGVIAVINGEDWSADTYDSEIHQDDGKFFLEASSAEHESRLTLEIDGTDTGEYSGSEVVITYDDGNRTYSSEERDDSAATIAQISNSSFETAGSFRGMLYTSNEDHQIEIESGEYQGVEFVNR